MIFSAIKQQIISAFSFRKYWKTFLFILLFDALLLGCLYAAAIIFDAIFSRFEASLTGNYSGYGLLLGYLVVVCFAYSFFTYCNLSFLNSIRPFQHSFEFTKKKIFFFFLYTIIIGFTAFAGFFLLWTFTSISLVTILKQTIVPILLFSYIFFSSLFLQLSHLVFIAHREISFKELLKKIVQLFSFQWIGQWLLWNIIGGIITFLGYILLFTLLSSISKTIANTGNLMQFYALNIVIFLYLVFVVYCFFFFNRLYLFVIIKKEIEKKKI